MAIAAWWKNHPQYQDIIVGVRIGGGYHGEWGNGPAKDGTCAQSSYSDYGSFMGFWSQLANNVTKWAAQASAASKTSDGKQLYFIFESKPSSTGRTGEPTVGYKFNAVDVMGLEIFLPRNEAGMTLDSALAYYHRYYPSHFGGLETRYGHAGDGSFDCQLRETKSAGAYWNSLLALEAEPDFFDFHGNYWEDYSHLTGLDLFMQDHLVKRCDGAEDGFIAFREVAKGYRKEATPCGKTTNPACDVGDEGYNDGGLTLNYGDVDICLYSPRVTGVQFDPVRNDYYQGEIACPDPNYPYQKRYTKAKGQHYIVAGYDYAFQSRKLVSQYAYVDIDEGLTHRAGNSWDIKVVYYDGNAGESDKFSVDYYSTSGAIKSLTVTKGGSEIFKEAAWTVTDLRTDNPFTEASADLRLNNQKDGADIFHSVHVRPTDGSPPVDNAPSAPANFQVQ